MTFPAPGFEGPHLLLEISSQIAFRRRLLHQQLLHEPVARSVVDNTSKENRS